MLQMDTLSSTLDKRCTKMGGSEIAKEPNEKKGFL
jgi:hypothetical protein